MLNNLEYWLGLLESIKFEKIHEIVHASVTKDQNSNLKSQKPLK